MLLDTVLQTKIIGGTRPPLTRDHLINLTNLLLVVIITDNLVLVI